MLMVVLAGSAVAAGCTGDDPDTPAAPSTTGPGSATTSPGPSEPIEVVNTDAWPMHSIDGRFRGANALGAADVNGDGHRDYVTNYEFDQRWILAVHPGDDGDTRVSWPTVEIWKPDPFESGNGKNPESTALGDFDGDGNIDAAGAHGFSDIAAFEGSAPGVHLVWGPPADELTDPEGWLDGGWVPATVDVGHPHWVVAQDVNGDGLTDVAVGGRQHGGGGGYENPDSPNGNGTFTGIGWLEAPAAPTRRRDLSAWQLHRIDADVPSGHGFVFADLDGDGYDDIIDATADFDTPEDAEDVAWYENPGDGTPEQEQEWPRTVLHQSDDFYAKPSVAVGDLDGDGDADIVTQTDRELLLFRNRGGAPLEFDTVALTKPEEIAWLSRPVRLDDFDGDGDLDVFGMLIHDDNELPPTKASAFLYLNQGDPFTDEGWQLVPVKWGPGPTMALPGFGEKWDQVDVTDVDGDGDLDVVANCEEWWATPQFEAAPFFTSDLNVSSVAVVWFENILGDEPRVFNESDDAIEIQAERPSVIGDSSWVERAQVRADTSGAAGPPVAAMQAHNGLRPPDEGFRAPTDTTGLTYTVDADGGDYVIWARVLVPAAFAPQIGGESADSAWLIVDDGEPIVIGDDRELPTDSWQWVRVADPQPLTAGRHELHLRPREHGFAIDRFVLTTDRDYEPN
jgi:hypothetical protein